jgi:hypothetical protein
MKDGGNRNWKGAMEGLDAHIFEPTSGRIMCTYTWQDVMHDAA